MATSPNNETNSTKNQKYSNKTNKNNQTKANKITIIKASNPFEALKSYINRRSIHNLRKKAKDELKTADLHKPNRPKTTQQAQSTKTIKKTKQRT
jgi:hypothetical protein